MSEENWIGEMNVELTDLTNHEAGGLCAMLFGGHEH